MKNELETENHQLKSENGKLKNEVQSLKRQIKSNEKHYEDKLNTFLTKLENESNCAEKPEKPAKQQQSGTEEPTFMIPDDIKTCNRFSVLDEGSTESKHNIAPSVPLNFPLTDDNLSETTLNSHKPETTGNQKTDATGNQKFTENLRTSHNIVLLIDSNGKFIDTSKFNPHNEACKIFCPTVPSVIKTLSEVDLGKPSHIVIHVGTNDIEQNSVDFCHALFKEMIQLAATKYPTSSRMNPTLPVRYRSPNVNIDATNQPPTETTSRPQVNNPTMFDKKTYAQVTNMTYTRPMMPTQPATRSPYVDMNTVMGLLRLYESMRHS